MQKEELLKIIQKKYPEAKIKGELVIINKIDIDIEVTKYGFTLYLGDFNRKKVNTIEEVLKEI